MLVEDASSGTALAQALPSRVRAAEYRRELLGFPGGRHDDQVDSTTQFLIWAEERPKPRPPIRIGVISIPNPPGSISLRDDGSHRW